MFGLAHARQGTHPGHHDDNNNSNDGDNNDDGGDYDRLAGNSASRRPAELIAELKLVQRWPSSQAVVPLVPGGRSRIGVQTGPDFTGGRRTRTIPHIVRRALTLAGLVVGAALLLAAAGSPRGIKEGGTFRSGVAAGSVTTIDPALASSGNQHLLAPACGSLMDYPAKPLPEGGRLQPELAEADPRISGGGRVYTFTVRKDARFSDGSRVTARAFAHALERILTPAMESPWALMFSDIVGAQKMLDGKATTLAGAVAKGRTLTLRLTKRIPDFLSSVELLCAVSPISPLTRRGLRRRSRAQRPTTSRSTSRASGLCRNGTASTGVSVRTMSTASTPISTPM